MFRRDIAAVCSILLLLIVLPACNRTKGGNDSPANSSAPVQAVASASGAPLVSSAAPDSEAVAASAATFKGDKLVACIDASFSAGLLEILASAARDPSAPDAGVGLKELLDDDLKVYLLGGDSVIGALLNKRQRSAAAAIRPAGKSEPLDRECSTQFPGRQLIAKCSIVTSLGTSDAGKDRATLQIHHYDVAVGDGVMRACLAAKGEWWELPKDSAEYRRAQHQQLYRQLENTAK